jgi:hypothetical protein
MGAYQSEMTMTSPPPLTTNDIAALDNLRHAFRFVRQDKEDEIITDALRDIPFIDALDSRLKSIANRLLTGEYDPKRAYIVEVGKGNYTTRPMSHIAIDDWIVAQAILNLVAETLDLRIPKSSFAMRLSPARMAKPSARFFKKWYSAWPEFRNRVRRNITAKTPVVVITDISGYYEHIDLRLLAEMILEAGIPREIVNLIRAQLERWTWKQRYASNNARGLPQGNDVVGMYANFYLRELDEHFDASGIRYHRYMDDIAIHVRDVGEARRELAQLSQFVRQLGLSLNSAKTRILSGAAIEQYYQFVIGDELEAHLRQLRLGGESLARKTERRSLRKRLRAAPVPNVHLVRRLMTSYIRARDGSLRAEAFALLASQPEMTPNVCRYMKALDTDRVAADLAQLLDATLDSPHPAQQQNLLECLGLLTVRGAATRAKIRELGWEVTKHPQAHPYSRCLAALLLYRFGEAADIVRLVDRYIRREERHPLVQKHLALAVTRLNDPGRFIRVLDALKSEADPDLTDTGLFFEHVKRGGQAQIKAIVDRTRLIVDTYDLPKGGRVRRLDVRDLMLLNLCRFADDVRSRPLIKKRIDAWKPQIICPTSRALLAEVEARL